MERGEQALLRERKKHLLKPPGRVRSIQKALPSAKIYESGVMEIGHLYSAMFRIKDVDFSSGSEEDQEEFFKQFESILNGLDERTPTFKITIYNRRKDYLNTEYVPLPTNYDDGYDPYREDYNSMRKQNLARARGLVQERYITVTAERRNLELAEEYFREFEVEFSNRLSRIGSCVRRLNIRERMELFYDFYRPGME